VKIPISSSSPAAPQDEAKAASALMWGQPPRLSRQAPRGGFRLVTGHWSLTTDQKGVTRRVSSSYNPVSDSDVDGYRCCAKFQTRVRPMPTCPSAGCTAWCVQGAIGPISHHACAPASSVAT